MNPEMNADSSKDPDRLEREIDEQRREINETLRALEGKFTTQELTGQVMHYFGDQGREWAASLASSARSNPIPALLTAVGITWLMMSDRNGGGSYRSPYAYAPGDYEGERSGMYDGREGGFTSARGASGAMRDKVDDLGIRAAHAGEALHERAAHVGEALHDKAAHAGEALHDKATQAREALRERAWRARQGMGHSRDSVRNNFTRMAREQPLALGAVGIALGALIGAALPRTEHENRVLGRASERVREQGREMAREGYDKVSRKAAEVAEVAKDTLHRTVEETKRQAQQVQGSTGMQGGSSGSQGSGMQASSGLQGDSSGGMQGGGGMQQPQQPRAGTTPPQ